jgi:hypothetical protein
VYCNPGIRRSCLRRLTRRPTDQAHTRSRSADKAGDVGMYKIAATFGGWRRDGSADQGGDGGVSNHTRMTWSEYIQILALSIVLSAVGTAVFYCVAQLLP